MVTISLSEVFFTMQEHVVKVCELEEYLTDDGHRYKHQMNTVSCQGFDN